MSESENKKICWICKIEKSIEEFKLKDSWERCIICENDWNKKKYKKHYTF